MAFDGVMEWEIENAVLVIISQIAADFWHTSGDIVSLPFAGIEK